MKTSSDDPILDESVLSDISETQAEHDKKDQEQIEENNKVLGLVDQQVGNLEESDYSDPQFKSNMTLTQWEINSVKEQLKMYRDIVYEENQLTDEVDKNEVEKQLLE